MNQATLTCWGYHQILNIGVSLSGAANIIVMFARAYFKEASIKENIASVVAGTNNFAAMALNGLTTALPDITVSGAFLPCPLDK